MRCWNFTARRLTAIMAMVFGMALASPALLAQTLNENSSPSLLKKCLIELDQKMEKNPNNHELLFARGQIQFWLHDYKAASETMGQAIAAKPDVIEDYLLRFEAHDKLKEYKKAVADLDKIIGFGRNGPETYSLRAVEKMMAGDYEGAVKDADTSLSKRPSHADTLFVKGRSQFYMGKTENALVDLTKSIDCLPSASALNARADCYEKLGQSEKARADRFRAKELASSEALRQRAMEAAGH